MAKARDQCRANVERLIPEEPTPALPERPDPSSGPERPGVHVMDQIRGPCRSYVVTRVGCLYRSRDWRAAAFFSTTAFLYVIPSLEALGQGRGRLISNRTRKASRSALRCYEPERRTGRNSAAHECRSTRAARKLLNQFGGRDRPSRSVTLDIQTTTRVSKEGHNQDVVSPVHINERAVEASKVSVSRERGHHILIREDRSQVRCNDSSYSQRD